MMLQFCFIGNQQQRVLTHMKPHYELPLNILLRIPNQNILEIKNNNATENKNEDA
jgi:hypothetical protein